MPATRNSEQIFVRLLLVGLIASIASLAARLAVSSTAVVSRVGLERVSYFAISSLRHSETGLYFGGFTGDPNGLTKNSHDIFNTPQMDSKLAIVGVASACSNSDMALRASPTLLASSLCVISHRALLPAKTSAMYCDLKYL